MSDNPVYIQYFTPEWSRFNQIIQSFKGSRTMAQYAEDCKAISPSSLSRIATGKVTRPLPADVIISLYKSRDKNSEYSLEDLMKANGMIDEETHRRITSPSANQSVREIRNRESNMRNVIIQQLLKRGIAIKIHPETMTKREYIEKEFSGGIFLRPDLVIELPEEKRYKRWIFEFKAVSIEDSASLLNPNAIARGIFDRVSRYLIADAWAPDKYQDTKTTFVFLDKRICDAFRSFFRNNKLNNPMSTLLIDLSDGSVVSEELLNLGANNNIPKLFELPLINDGTDDEEDLFEDPLIVSDLYHNIDFYKDWHEIEPSGKEDR